MNNSQEMELSPEGTGRINMARNCSEQHYYEIQRSLVPSPLREYYQTGNRNVWVVKNPPHVKPDETPLPSVSILGENSQEVDEELRGSWITFFF